LVGRTKKNIVRYISTFVQYISRQLTTQQKQLFCNLHSQLSQCGQDNNAAESLASIRNNSGNNKPCGVSAVGNIGSDHAINNNKHDVAVVNNVGDTEIIHGSCGTGPDVNIDNDWQRLTITR
jgi:hypothetical protein